MQKREVSKAVQEVSKRVHVASVSYQEVSKQCLQKEVRFHRITSFLNMYSTVFLNCIYNNTRLKKVIFCCATILYVTSNTYTEILRVQI
jgi:hypothetical protein